MNHANGGEPSSIGTVNSSQLLPLPKLEVLREDFVTQELTDSAIRLLETANPPLVLKLLAVERASRQRNYYEIADEISEFLSREMKLGQKSVNAHLLFLDIISELSRRLRIAYSLPEVELQGQPLVNHLSAPLPPLTTLEIEHYSKNAGLSQELADKILGKLYQSRPDLWIAISEQTRRQLRLSNTDDEISREIHDLLIEEKQQQNINSKVGCLLSEAYRRISKMCKLD